MGNDNKITEEQKSNQIHKEVMLFLGEELERIHQSSSEQAYDIKKEYEKTKSNHSPFTALVLTGCFIVVFLIAFIITKTISVHNEEIKVSVTAFEDLNLKNLLNTVGAAQSNYDNAVKRRVTIESDMTIRLNAAEDTLKNDIFVVESMDLRSKKKYDTLMEAAQLKYDETIAAIKEEYEPMLIQADKEVEEYKKQLAEFDIAKIEAAKEKEKALDSERRVKELEQQKIKNQYESRISELDSKLAETQRRSSENMRAAVSSVSEQYQAQLEQLDPKLNDAKASSIIANARTSPAADFNGAASMNARGVSGQQVAAAVNDYQQLYDDYKYLDKAVASLPQKNSIPSYVSASHSLVNKMGETFVNTTSSLYKETVKLNGTINNLSNELAESRRQLLTQQESYEVAYETLLGLAKTSAVIVFGDSYDNMHVYVTPKARYLITEAGADAEFKADKTIKGKIFRAEDGTFYFMVGEDKNGNQFEVNFDAIVPGTPVKILSK